MFSSSEIRNVKFSKSVGGYKQEEVDILLDRIEADYDQYERHIKELQNKIGDMNKEVESYKNSQSSIQNVLLNAQKLADQIVDEAKTKSEEIVKNAEANLAIISAREKELSTAFEIKAGERKSQLEKEITNAINVAKLKSASTVSAAEDSVARQQILFDKVKFEVTAFKNEILKKYKEQIELIQKLPDEVPLDPSRISEVVAAAVDKAPDVKNYIHGMSGNEKAQEYNSAADDTQDDEINSGTGFVIASDDIED